MFDDSLALVGVPLAVAFVGDVFGDERAPLFARGLGAATDVTAFFAAAFLFLGDDGAAFFLAAFFFLGDLTFPVFLVAFLFVAAFFVVGLAVVPAFGPRNHGQ